MPIRGFRRRWLALLSSMVLLGLADCDSSLDSLSSKRKCSDSDVTELLLQPDHATITVGVSVTVTAALKADCSATDVAIRWSSQNESIAKPANTAGVTNSILGVAPGTTNITVSAGNLARLMPVTVVADVGTVTVAPATSTIAIGQTVPLTATVRDNAGNIVTDPSTAVTWSVSGGAATLASPAARTVVAVGSSPGTSTVTATVGGKTGTAQVTVIGNTITVNPASGTIQVGQTLPLTATVRDGNQNVLNNVPITWTTGNSSIVAIPGSSSGSSVTVLGAAPGGPILVTATAGIPNTASGSASITVSASAARLAYALADQPSQGSYTIGVPKAFNSGGGPVRVTRSARGTYAVSFDSLQKPSGRKETVIITSAGVELNAEFNMCRVAGWSTGSSGLTVNVGCTDSDGDADDQGFSLLVLGDDAIPGRFAFTLADQPASASYTPADATTFMSSGQTPTATRSATGVYAINLPGEQRGPTTDREAVIISAVGGASERCGTDVLSGTSVKTQCVLHNGTTTDSKYSLALIGNDPTHTYGIARVTQQNAILLNSDFNKSGGAVTVSHLSAGVTDVTFAGLGTTIGTGAVNVQVSASDGTSECKLASIPWQVMGDGRFVVHVQCFDKNEISADVAYTVVVIK